MYEKAKFCEACRASDAIKSNSKLNSRSGERWFNTWWCFFLVILLAFEVLLCAYVPMKAPDVPLWRVPIDLVGVLSITAIASALLSLLVSVPYWLRSRHLRLSAKSIYYYVDTEGGFHRHSVSPIIGTWQILLELPTNGLEDHIFFKISYPSAGTNQHSGLEWFNSYWKLSWDLRGWWVVSEQGHNLRLEVKFTDIERATRFVLLHAMRGPSTVLELATTSSRLQEINSAIGTTATENKRQLDKIAVLVDESRKRGRAPLLAREIDKVLGRAIPESIGPTSDPGVVPEVGA